MEKHSLQIVWQSISKRRTRWRIDLEGSCHISYESMMELEIIINKYNSMSINHRDINHNIHSLYKNMSLFYVVNHCFVYETQMTGQAVDQSRESTVEIYTHFSFEWPRIVLGPLQKEIEYNQWTTGQRRWTIIKEDALPWFAVCIWWRGGSHSTRSYKKCKIWMF